MADPTGRILTLLATLQTGRMFAGSELSARLGVSSRTLRRDVDRLRSYGYPVETQPGPSGHYQLAAGSRMPPLALDDDEAIAALIGLATLASTEGATQGSVGDAAARAYGKIDQFLPKRLRHRAAQFRAGMESSTTHTPSPRAGDLTILAEAIHRQQVVAFNYTTTTGEVAHRRVEPHRQIHRQMRWYLLGWDRDKTAWRVFRTDRMSDLEMLTSGFTARELPAESALNYLRQGFNKDRQRVVLTVNAPLPDVADALRHQEVELSPIDEQNTSAVVMLDSWQWLVLSLAFLDADFTVHEPAEFRAACLAFGARLGRSGAAPGETS